MISGVFAEKVSSIFAEKKVLVDPHPAWGGWIVAVIAAVAFVAFSVWIVMQRVKHGHGGSGENE